jgi:hypothetical protein
MTKRKRLTDKHGKNVIPDPVLAERIKKRAIEGRLPCAVAFKISEELKIEPASVGVALDLLEIKISKCQIGIFGYDKGNKIAKPIDNVPDFLERAVRENLAMEKLPCRSVWQIAENLGIGKMDVTAACDALGIKVSPCQLGAF